MKKIFLLIVASFVFYSVVLSQNITESAADAIVLKRMHTEARGHTIYAKYIQQTEFAITTSMGEVLELDYPCYLYYIRYEDQADETPAGHYWVVKASNGSFLEVNTKNDVSPDLTTWRIAFQCQFDNPLTDLPFLKEFIDYATEQQKIDFRYYARILQCIYKDKDGIGFFLKSWKGCDKEVYSSPFMNCDGEIICYCDFSLLNHFGQIHYICDNGLYVDVYKGKQIWEINPDPPYTIDTLYQNPLSVIQKSVEGKWQLNQITHTPREMPDGTISPWSTTNYANTFVDISENDVVMSGTDSIDYSLYTFSYSWKRMEVNAIDIGRTITTYVMWNDKQNRGEWYFVLLKCDDLWGWKYDQSERYNFRRIRE